LLAFAARFRIRPVDVKACRRARLELTASRRGEVRARIYHLGRRDRRRTRVRICCGISADASRAVASDQQHEPNRDHLRHTTKITLVDDRDTHVQKAAMAMTG
jgi:hypothetical protein